MSWIQDHFFVLLFLLAYTALMAHHARVGQRRTRGLADYYIGGRNMGGWAVGLSFFATYSSTNSFVGFSGQAYSFGVPWLLLVPVLVFFSVVAWRFIAPRLCRFTAALDSVTLPDFIGFRFHSENARMLASLIVLFASFLYMTAVFKGIGNLVEVFLGLSYGLAILLVLVIVMVYTALGGFISVVRTDVVQGVVMILAAVLLSAGTIRAAGGPGAFLTVRDVPGAEHLFTWDAAMPFPFLLGIFFAGTVKFIVEPRQLSRFYALQDPGEARKGMWVSSLSFLFVYSLLMPLGVFARHLFPDGVEDTDRIVPLLLTGEYFHPALGAFLLVAMVAAAMSSLDSVLLVMASTFERDVVGVLRPAASEARAVRATRLYVGLFAIITALIALNPPGGIVTLTSFSGSLYAACFFPAVVLGLYWRGGNSAGVLASFAVGVLVVLGWRFVPWSGTIHYVFPAIAASTLVHVAVGLVSKSTAGDGLRDLFANPDGGPVKASGPS